MIARQPIAACVSDCDPDNCRCTPADRAIASAPDVRDLHLERIGGVLWKLANTYRQIAMRDSSQLRTAWAVYAAAERLLGERAPGRYEWRPTDRPLLENALQAELDERAPDSGHDCLYLSRETLSDADLLRVGRRFGIKLSARWLEEREAAE